MQNQKIKSGYSIISEDVNIIEYVSFSIFFHSAELVLVSMKIRAVILVFYALIEFDYRLSTITTNKAALNLLGLVSVQRSVRSQLLLYYH